MAVIRRPNRAYNGINLGDYNERTNYPKLENIKAEDGDYYNVIEHKDRSKVKYYNENGLKFRMVYKVTERSQTDGSVVSGVWQKTGDALVANITGKPTRNSHIIIPQTHNNNNE